MFRITYENIDIEKQKEIVTDDQAGAIVCFDGRVRNHNDGKPVNSLEYECYVDFANNEGSKIMQEALEKYDILKADCIHRAGHLQIGDVAISTVVSAAHRKEAFEACEYIVYEVKHRVSIWKKEHYQNQQETWLNA